MSPVEVARRLRCLPIGAARGELTLALEPAADAAVVDEVGRLTGQPIFPVRCAAEQLDRAIAAAAARSRSVG